MKFYNDPVYIEMCAKAEEMQGNRIWEDGDFFFYEKSHYVYADWANNKIATDYHGTEIFYYFGGGYEWDVEELCKKSDAIFLPRLDQLIEMCMDDDLDRLNILGDFIQWKNDPYGFGTMPFPRQLEKLTEWQIYVDRFEWSLEQQFLAFLMYEKHGKRWTGEEWEAA